MSYWKPCPKCETGTVRTSSDRWGDYLRCINCGMTADLPDGDASYARVQRHLLSLAPIYAEASVPASEPVEALPDVVPLPAVAPVHEQALAA